MKDAMFRRGNLSLTRQIGAERRGEVDDEDCRAHSEFLRRAADVSEKRTRDRVFVKECIDFLGNEDSGMFTRSAAKVGRMVRKATENQSRSDDGFEITGCIGDELCLSVGKSWCLLPPNGGMPTRSCAILISPSIGILVAAKKWNLPGWNECLVDGCYRTRIRVA
jgi:hypothetical protein